MAGSSPAMTEGAAAMMEAAATMKGRATMTEGRAALTRSGRAMTRSRLAMMVWLRSPSVAHPRIEHSVQDVDAEIDQYIDAGDHQQRALDDRVIPPQYR